MWNKWLINVPLKLASPNARPTVATATQIWCLVFFKFIPISMTFLPCYKCIEVIFWGILFTWMSFCWLKQSYFFLKLCWIYFLFYWSAFSKIKLLYAQIHGLIKNKGFVDITTTHHYPLPSSSHPNSTSERLRKTFI